MGISCKRSCSMSLKVNKNTKQLCLWWSILSRNRSTCWTTSCTRRADITSSPFSNHRELPVQTKQIPTKFNHFISEDSNARNPHGMLAIRFLSYWSLLACAQGPLFNPITPLSDWCRCCIHCVSLQFRWIPFYWRCSIGLQRVSRYVNLQFMLWNIWRRRFQVPASSWVVGKFIFFCIVFWVAKRV